MTGENLASGHDESLRGGKDTGVDRADENVHALEMHPHGVNRIYQASMNEGVRQQELAELVLDPRVGDRKPRQ